MLVSIVASTGYVGWGGRALWVQADQPLGYGSARGFPEYGIRRAIWDACFGFVNGFRLSAIVYYVLTRSLNRRVCIWALRREGWEVRDGIPVAPASGLSQDVQP